ncbi:N,N-dimethylformamidase beta subunit family domain-containing protein [Streptomyces sp. NPDC005969]|uniref:N,N-dimethylformamidase beta subunit family domain-containing protein n=1 Tax=Streptomyces sp. NPDC005969 TaxID=3156722 RepID=UPI0033D93B22
MSKVSRRTALGAFGVGAAALAGYRLLGESDSAARAGNNPVVRENRASGSRKWAVGRGGTKGVTDELVQMQGYASKTSVGCGESIDFHLSSHLAQDCTVAIYRIGHYGGSGARHLLTSDPVPVRPRTKPTAASGTGLIACDWPVAWTLDVPKTWVSGIFLAVFTSQDGYRAFTPFVVRDTARRSDILMVVPFTTYQAYNFWPYDGHGGKNLYRGFTAEGVWGGIDDRAFKVSFDRPYTRSGTPNWFKLDTGAARWAESAGYDITYASSVDLHEGRVDPSHYRVMMFSGHDEYWSKEMRDCAEKAVSAGTHLAFLAANNIYFHIRLEDSADGRSGRVVTCYKESPDPEPGPSGPTARWRDLGTKHQHAEQGLLGVQYNGILKNPVPLIVRESGHWFWSGTGLRDGDEIPDLIAVETDGFDPSMPRPADTELTLLSASPYADRLGRGHFVQNTGLSENQQGTLVFVAGTFHWPLALDEPGHVNPHVRRATRNLLTRMLEHRGA